ncbi:cystinosin isoform X2 [Hippocampus comes]|uniref:Cystinosin, lysosomal cystine transporter n=2 Tax=Hippocampus comes TaxID=109280 RepID=A0A3Q2YKJ1_HIPCM|nr:PREDICTED: cystinosin isoform X2 [Hippocampus comes]XP_019711421.1 PREDICTED: cystinosin isoform X2 [Hippocampus comes]XP_019711422.1 PREDICTED: cystinosin isoform X2 [Hippocampus comes]XP_019711423.1 PREDICTED: cystinosin isoform X2 [Hippocampus comes]
MWLPQQLSLLPLLPLWLLIDISESQVLLSVPEEVTLQEWTSGNLTMTSSLALPRPLVVRLNVTYSSKSNSSEIIGLPQQVTLPIAATSVTFTVTARASGQVTVYLMCDAADGCGSEPRLRFMVVRSNAVALLSEVVGWVYFLAWSVSFYPQVWENWRRKSVVGLHFDFLALNLTGFFAYSVFNIGLFWVTPIKEEFLQRNPNGINPVKPNDVFFSLHGFLLCLLYVGQAAVYESGGQRVSWTARLLLLIGWSFAGVTLFLAVFRRLSWLDYLYFFSYIKLAVTLVKYLPQAFLNYRRKSTEGWSIGTVLLDLSGGLLSISQMILDSYNNDEWHLIFGDPTKFGLGLFSVVFDMLFLFQHYCLYRSAYRLIRCSEVE